MEVRKNILKKIEPCYYNSIYEEKQIEYIKNLYIVYKKSLEYDKTNLLFKYTNIEQKFNIVGFLDSSKSKNNTKFKNYLISNPNINNISKESNIIIASSSSEKTIYDSLKLFRKKGINTYCLYS